MSASPFHAGEQHVQQRIGVHDSIEPWARKIVRPFLPDEHRAFYSELPFVVASARDAAGRPWVTMLTGEPGFVQSPDDRHLEFATRPLPGDALASALVPGAALGLLGIELESRRRNRVNGWISRADNDGIGFDVGQTFGNCPQYITERLWYRVDVDPERVAVSRRDRLDTDMQAWISAADTLFIGSGYAADNAGDRRYGMDASHRGGPAGFVEVADERRLVVPDYAGNNHFNTIGNLVMDPRVGLLFVDFENGSLLQLSGTARIDWDSDDVAKHAGAQRLIEIDVDAVVRLDGVLPLSFTDAAGSVRSLRVLRKTLESDDVVSFELVARDGGDLPDFQAGQHLPIELDAGDASQSLKRTYSLSNPPGQGYYRLSVKREPGGVVSRLLHDTVGEGDVLRARPPAGEFTLAAGDRPVVLASAGIGVTPMVSMLGALAAPGSNRPVYFLHGARDGAHHALAGEVRTLAAQHDHVTLRVYYSRPRGTDALSVDFDRIGRLTGDEVAALIPDMNADFYLCGPLSFLAELTTSLTELGVSDEYIHSETFGPAAG